jgi:hypothetical protein
MDSPVSTEKEKGADLDSENYSGSGQGSPESLEGHIALLG